MWRNVNSNRSATFFLLFLFVALPVLFVPSAFDPDLNPRIIAVSLLCTAFLFMGIRSFSLPESFRRTGLSVIGIIAISLLSVFSSLNTGEAIAEWLRIVVVYSFLILSVSLFYRRKTDLKLILRSASFSVLILCAVAIVQSIPVVKAILEHKDFTASSNIASTLSNKNFFSETLVLLLPVVFYALIYDEKKFRLIHVVSFFLAAFYIFLLTSLACWTAVIIAVMAVGLVSVFHRASGTFRIPRKTKIIFSLSMIIFVIAGAVVIKKVPVIKGVTTKINMASDYISDPGLLQKNVYANNNSVFDRIMMIRNSIRMIKDHPLAGVGMNNWKLIYPFYGVGGTEVINSGAMNFEHPHNDYLLIFSEQGIFGLVAYLLFFFFVLKLLFSKIKNSTPEERSFIYVILFSVISFMVISLFSYPRSRMYTPVILMFFIALLFMRKDENEKSFSLKPLVVFLIAAFCLSSAVIASIRLDSEIHAKKMIQAKYQNNFARMMRESEKINSYFFPLEYSNSSIEWYRGMALFYSGQVPAALNAYKSAIERTPYHLRTLNDLATAYERTGMPDSAIVYYKRALAISPYLNDARFNLSATYFNQNKIDSAYAVLNFLRYKELEIGPHENYVQFMTTILGAMITDSLQKSSDTLLVADMTGFIKDIERTKRYIRAYKGRTLWPDVFTDKK